MESDANRGTRRVGFIFGTLLILGGVGLLAAQMYGYDVRLDIDRLGWPIFVIVPGLLLLFAGLVLSDEPGVGLAIAGGIVTMVGLVLAYQRATDHYSSWAYAWALVAPGGVGAAMILWGVLHLRGSLIRTGLGTLGVALVLFLVGFAFFEGVLDIGNGRGLAAYGSQALPYALIVAGVLIVLGWLWPGRSRRQMGTWREDWRTQAAWTGQPPSGGPPVGGAQPGDAQPDATAEWTPPAEPGAHAEATDEWHAGRPDDADQRPG